MQPRLVEVQRLLYRLITSPNGVEEGLAVENDLPKNGIGALITGDHRMNAVDRVGIYADVSSIAFSTRSEKTFLRPLRSSVMRISTISSLHISSHILRAGLRSPMRRGISLSSSSIPRGARSSLSCAM